MPKLLTQAIELTESLTRIYMISLSAHLALVYCKDLILADFQTTLYLIKWNNYCGLGCVKISKFALLNL